MKLIVAMDKNNGIGKNNKLPWHYPEDLKYFKNCTLNSSIVMGSNTWNSLPNGGLPNRTNYVITSNPLGFNFEPDFVISSIDEIPQDSWIIGGKQLYESTQHLINEMHITRIQNEYDCDTFLVLDFTDFEKLKTVWLSDEITVEVYVRKTNE